MRRAAVLAELGRCTEYMSYLLSVYDKDKVLFQRPVLVRSFKFSYGRLECFADNLEVWTPVARVTEYCKT